MCRGLALGLASAMAALSCAREGADRSWTTGRSSACAGAVQDFAPCQQELDELLAAEAPEAARRWVERTTLARALAARATQRAAQRGAPSDDEIERVADLVWPRFNTGAFVSVVHALFPKGDAARSRAEALALRVPREMDSKAFEELAHGAGADVVVELITHVGNRGRTLEGQALERAFANAANELTMTGRRLAVVETSYGHHVILATERAEPRPIDARQVRIGLENEAIAERARAELEKTWKQRRIVLVPDTKETLGKLPLGP